MPWTNARADSAVSTLWGEVWGRHHGITTEYNFQKVPTECNFQKNIRSYSKESNILIIRVAYCKFLSTIVRYPSRWSLYCYLDFFDNHLTTQITERERVQQCSISTTTTTPRLVPWENTQAWLVTGGQPLTNPLESSYRKATSQAGWWQMRYGCTNTWQWPSPPLAL